SRRCFNTGALMIPTRSEKPAGGHEKGQKGQGKQPEKCPDAKAPVNRQPQRTARGQWSCLFDAHACLLGYECLLSNLKVDETQMTIPDSDFFILT
ncbi:MAG: hypothetical protein KDF64_14210, partial [Geminicoccaceae bacterium]|nr:hypothetical protein [Geminicoccaceae bacterium]